MREILVINPRKRKKKAARGRKGVSTMARRRKRRAATPKRRRRSYRRKNPSRARRTARRVGTRLLSGLSIRTALKDQIPIQIGMLAAKWAEKRFGPDASDLDPESWSWASYAKGGVGAVAAAMIANAIKPGMGQKVLVGGLAQVVNRLVRNELIEKSSWAVGQFGADEGEQIVVDSDGTPYLGAGNEYIPIDESYRLPMGYGDSVVAPSPLGQLEPVGPLGAADDFRDYVRAYS